MEQFHVCFLEVQYGEKDDLLLLKRNEELQWPQSLGFSRGNTMINMMIDTMIERLRLWWQKIKQHLVTTLVIAILLGVAIVLIIVEVKVYGTGFQRKTLWDWLQLFIIPLVLAVGGYLFNLTVSRNERDIARDNQQEATLQEYINKMSELLLERKLRESELGSEVRKIARVRTLTVLLRLNGSRKRSVLLFLYEAGLINKGGRIVDLTDADLSEADLREANLSGADLRGANLSRATLREATLREATLSGTNLSGAILDYADMSGTNLSGASLWSAPLGGADLFFANLSGANLSETCLLSTNLFGADLSGAILHGANLGGAILFFANLSGANLSKADLFFAKLGEADLHETILSQANLRNAKVTQEQLDKAKTLKDAIMPKGSKYP
jgi:uncharacterized protein YjbI with pentapeptide repeats